MASPKKFDPVYLNSRRETVFVLIAWIVFCVWVVGYCLRSGYDIDPQNLKTVIGMPAWIFWGVALPWVMANVVTIWFALKFMADDPLEDPTDVAPDAAAASQTVKEENNHG
jgi:hypothetical protein